MKSLFYTVLSILFCANTLLAQGTFTVVPNPASVTADPSQSDAPAEAVITNLTNFPKNIRWERIIIELPATMSTQVCDPNLCWLSTVSTKTFTLAGNASGQLIVHFLNPQHVTGSAIVHIKLTNIDDPTEVLTAVFNYNPPAAGVHDLPAATVKMFPNPTVDQFKLENADAVSAVRVFSLDGRQVAFLNATPDQQYSIANQPVGTYVLSLLDKNGRSFQALEISKN
ncbi:MAG: T9SS type A sorting domain-containing protein [Bacteroidota bacterium]